METRVTAREGDKITIQTEINLSGSMLSAEQAILNCVNEVGAMATEEKLKYFDADGKPIVLGDIKWYSRGQQPKTYQTPYGEIEVTRHLYQRAGGGVTYCPLEDGARIVHGASPRFAKMVSHKLVLMPAEHVMSDLAENHGRSLSKLLVQDLTKTVGEIAQDKEEHGSYAPAEIKAPITTISFGLDGAFVRLCDQQWREAMAGSIAFYDANGERQSTIYIGAAPEYGKDAFYRRFDQEIRHAQAQFPDARYVGVADGSASNWEFLKPRVEQEILDFYHVSEYLADAADAIWCKPKDKDKRHAWLNERCSRLKHQPEGAEDIFKELQAINVHGWPPSRAKQFATCLTYFTHQRHRMKYADYQKAGMPIGSGVTEAACKTLIKQRLCCSGMRWTERGAQVILSLRALVLSTTRWTQFWNKIDQYGVPK